MPYQQIDPQAFDFLGRYMRGQQQALQNKQQEHTMGQQDAMFSMRQREFEAQQAQAQIENTYQEKQRTQTDEDRKNGVIAASTQWALLALDSGQPFDSASSPPEVQQMMQEMGNEIIKNGGDPRSLSKDQLRQLLQAGFEKSSSLLRKGPPQQPQPTGMAAEMALRNKDPSGYDAFLTNKERIGHMFDKSGPQAAPSGYMADPADPRKLKFIPGGPADPDKPVTSPFTGREAMMFQRVVSSANEAAQTIQNITELPEGASSGWFGVGANPGTSIFSSAKGVLTNKLSSQETQDFNTMLPGLARSLATIGTAGLAPPGALTQGFEKLELREGDTGYTKLHKLAEYRQIVERGIETNLSNPRIPDQQKEAVKEIIRIVKDAIPFTHHDVTELQRRQFKEPNLTLAQLVKNRGLGSSSGLPKNAAPDGVDPAVWGAMTPEQQALWP